MPRAIEWTTERDAAVRDLIGSQRRSLRDAEAEIGISRSALAKRADTIGARLTSEARNRVVTGAEAVPAGHPITWAACFDGEVPAWPLGDGS